MRLFLLSLPVSLIIMAIFFISPVPAEENSTGVIFGSRVRIRTGPGTQFPVAGQYDYGRMVSVTGRSGERDTLGVKGSYGYYWYRIGLSPEKPEWVYGQFCYIIGGRDFYDSGQIADRIRAERINLGGTWTFAIAVEEAYPVTDENGLTGSTVHAMPLLVPEKGNFTRIFWIDGKKSPRIIFREPAGNGSCFRLSSSDGIIEKVSGLSEVTWGGEPGLRLDISYHTQDTSGKYSITAVKRDDRMLIVQYRPL